MILRVNIETREAQTHAIGIIANLRSKLWTGEIPQSSGHTHRQTNNIRHVLFVGKSLWRPDSWSEVFTDKKSVDINNFTHKLPPPVVYRKRLLVASSGMSNAGPSHNLASTLSESRYVQTLLMRNELRVSPRDYFESLVNSIFTELVDLILMYGTQCRNKAMAT